VCAWVVGECGGYVLRVVAGVFVEECAIGIGNCLFLSVIFMSNTFLETTSCTTLRCTSHTRHITPLTRVVNPPHLSPPHHLIKITCTAVNLAALTNSISTKEREEPGLRTIQGTDSDSGRAVGEQCLGEQEDHSSP
jgi:hypothetical protein